MQDTFDFINQYYDGRKILLPYQFWYPLVNVYRDRINSTNYNEFTHDLEKKRNRKKDAMIYIHIPFCNSKCKYCDFEKAYRYDEMDAYINLVIKEMEKYAKYPYINQLLIKSIYIGGGTPTILQTQQLIKLFNRVRTLFNLDKNVIINIECSPNTINDEKMQLFRENSVSRVSMGVQSFNEKTRKELSISSRTEDIYNGIKIANNSNIDISIDLMYGFEHKISDEENRIASDIHIASSLNIASIELNMLYPSTAIYKNNNCMLNTQQITQVMECAFELLKQNGFAKISDVTYKRKEDARFILDAAYYGVSDDVLDCIAIGAGARGYIAGHRYINTMYSRYMKGNDYIICLKHLSNVEVEKLKMIGFAKRLYLSKKYEENTILRNLFVDKIEELCKYNILHDMGDKLCLSKSAEYYIDNIYYFMLDDVSKVELQRSNLIYYFNK